MDIAEKFMGEFATGSMERINDSSNVIGTIIINREGFPETTTLDSLTAATYANHMRVLCTYAKNMLSELDPTDGLVALRLISKKTEAAVIPDDEFHIVAVMRLKTYR